MLVVSLFSSLTRLSSLGGLKSANWIPLVRQSMESKRKICTHNGVFHCDDVLACYLLKQLPEYADAKIIRTRNPEIIDDSDIVVDVGGVYDHNRRRYDHHQRDFNHTLQSLDPRKPRNIKLSSAGLVYHHYGRTIISRLLGLPDKFSSASLSQKGDGGDTNQSADDQIETLFDTIYESFIQEIDAIDNGVTICEGKPRYTINSDLSSRVAHLRPNWNEESTDEILYERFLQAIKLVGGEFEDRVKYYGNVWYPVKLLVKEAILNRSNVHPSKSIIDLSSYGNIPWKEHLFTIEEELNIVGEIKFAIYPDENDNWRISCVPIFSKSFVNRCPLHADWRGLRDEKLSQVAGVPNCIFVHASGFIGGAKSKKSCIALAEKTLAWASNTNKLP